MTIITVPWAWDMETTHLPSSLWFPVHFLFAIYSLGLMQLNDWWDGHKKQKLATSSYNVRRKRNNIQITWCDCSLFCARLIQYLWSTCALILRYKYNFQRCPSHAPRVTETHDWGEGHHSKLKLIHWELLVQNSLFPWYLQSMRWVLKTRFLLAKSSFV